MSSLKENSVLNIVIKINSVVSEFMTLKKETENKLEKLSKELNEFVDMLNFYPDFRNLIKPVLSNKEIDEINEVARIVLMDDEKDKNFNIIDKYKNDLNYNNIIDASDEDFDEEEWDDEKDFQNCDMDGSIFDRTTKITEELRKYLSRVDANLYSKIFKDQNDNWINILKEVEERYILEKKYNNKKYLKDFILKNYENYYKTISVDTDEFRNNMKNIYDKYAEYTDNFQNSEIFHKNKTNI